MTIGIMSRSLNIFLSRCSTKVVSNIDENSQVLKLLLVTFDVNLVVDLDLRATYVVLSLVL